MISIIQTNTGMRMSVMPGARMFRIVTMKLIADGHRPDPEHDEAHGPEVRAVAGQEALRSSGCS